MTPDITSPPQILQAASAIKGDEGARLGSLPPLDGEGAERSEAGGVVSPSSMETRTYSKPRHTPNAKALAKKLRKELTGPEAKLWAHLKRIKTIDTHFRKQAALGPYVVDFVCVRSRLIIEVDGEQHGFDRQLRHDLKRTQFLESHGFRVLRFWNHEVLKEMNAVLDTIYAAFHGNTDPVSASERIVHPLRPFGPPPPSRWRSSASLAPLPPLDGEGAERSEAGGVEHLSRRRY